ncbi:MAG: hypothetical protein AAGA16_04420 [Cyanobacteria bacterium P01_E01_bin.35]
MGIFSSLFAQELIKVDLLPLASETAAIVASYPFSKEFLLMKLPGASWLVPTTKINSPLTGERTNKTFDASEIYPLDTRLQKASDFRIKRSNVAQEHIFWHQKLGKNNLTRDLDWLTSLSLADKATSFNHILGLDAHEMNHGSDDSKFKRKPKPPKILVIKNIEQNRD